MSSSPLNAFNTSGSIKAGSLALNRVVWKGIKWICIQKDEDLIIVTIRNDSYMYL